MTVSANTQAILLLTARFGKGDEGANKPLTPKEYGRFAEWLRAQALMPERLLSGDLQKLLHGWQDKTVGVERIGALLDRGSALALSMEKWLRAGLWVMTRSDADYPKRLKRQLRGDSPAVLFGCGNRALLNAGGLAVVGSRKISQDDLAYSGRIGEMASIAGVSIVSGGARGVDETAMLGALGAEGTAVGVLADSLLRACSSGKYRRALMENNLALISPFNPEAGFNAGNAMARNKYIYCLSDAALAVHSGMKGGTWSGAQEDLKKGWVPLWVKQTDDPEAGNKALIAAGAIEAPADIGAVSIEGFFKATDRQAETAQDLFNGGSPTSEEATPVAPKAEEVVSEKDAEPRVEEGKIDPIAEGDTGDTDTTTEENAPEPFDISRVSFYELFLRKVFALCSADPQTTDDLSDALEVNKTQVNAWLKQAVEDGHMKKLSKPVRYEINQAKQELLALE